jgi:hypothetical protein
MIFAASPTINPAAVNIVPPAPLLDTDITNLPVLTGKLRDATAYHKRLKRDLAYGENGVSPADVNSAKIYKSQVVTATLVGSINRNAQPTLANDVVDLLAPFLTALEARIMQRVDAVEGAVGLRVDAVGLRVDAVGLRVDAVGHRITSLSAKAFNSSAIAPNHSLEPLCNAAGVLPINFPATRLDLFELSNPEATALLQFYQLPAIAGNTAVVRDQKRLAIAAYIGVRQINTISVLQLV